MRTLLIVLVSALLPLGATACGEGSSGGSGSAGQSGGGSVPSTAARSTGSIEDPRAADLWLGVMDSIAPDHGWQKTRYIQFDWIVSRPSGPPLRRSHRWDRYEGTYRVEAPVDSARMVALFNVNHPTDGERIWMDGERVADGPRSDSLAQRAYAMFINDSYWLLFPFKWADPGAHLRSIGQQEEWGMTYDAVELTFDSVGLTPQNKYRAYIDPSSGMFELWSHYPNASDSTPAFTLHWTDWKKYGPILLSDRREDRNGDSRIYFENLAASTEVPDGAFDPPAGG